MGKTPAYARLVGIPYTKMNCWDLTREFYRLMFEAELKSYFEGSSTPAPKDVRSLVYSNIGDFEKVAEGPYLLGDIILIKLYGVETHMGIFLSEDRFLHTLKGTDSHIDKVSRWHTSIVGYYRLREIQK